MELRPLADAFWEDVVRDHPAWATVLGDHRYDDRLANISPAAIAAAVARDRATLDAARAIDPTGLAPRERVTRQMLIDVLEGLIAVTETGVHEWAVDPQGGPQTVFPDLVEFQVVTTPEDGRNLIARWRAMGPHLDQAIANLRRALADGRLEVDKPVERVIDELRGIEAHPVADWRLAEPAKAPHEDWPPRDLAAFRAGVLAAVGEVVIPAFRRYREVLEHEILPAARPSTQPGLQHVPGGAEAYRAHIRYHTSLDLDPVDVHETGRREIARIDAAFVELGGRLLGTTDLASTLAALRTDPALRFSTADEVFDTAQRSLERAQAETPKWFGRLPKAACEVVRIPEHSEVHQTIAYYAWPALDGSRPGRYYINLYAPETRPRYEAECLAFHEAVPGHHLQIAIGQELDGLPAFQRLLGATAFVEGWGLYTERLSEEMGLYSGELDRFGILSFDAWRAGRLVVDTGMHALGWTRQEAIDYLHDHTALGDNNIENEVDRYITSPAQALAYKIGQLEILRLRAEAEARLGTRFDIRDFHDVVLGNGAISLPTLTSVLGSWKGGPPGA
jgi:uncharacterized protein (DUF885 family)